MSAPLHHGDEAISNAERDQVARFEPKALRTYTPSQAVLAKSAGVFHWTPEGKKLFDFSSGVLVANLGHNPTSWMKRFVDYMGWATQPWAQAKDGQENAFFSGTALTAYNAVTAVEAHASQRLAELLLSRPGGQKFGQVLWAASGSEAIQKALWTALARDKKRDMILATRFGFHGKKGLAGAVTGCETDKERDPRVRFIVTPASQAIYCAASEAGIITTLANAGAVVTASTCGACGGTHMGILGENEACITASTRNFKGRMGESSARIYMGSPATAATSAIRGFITGPRELLQ